MARKSRVAVIFGGRSGEHEVSLLSARTVMAALDPGKYEVVPIGITKDGRWLIGGDPMAALVAALRRASAALALHDQSKWLLPAAGPHRLGDYQIDLAFPVLHGTFGEDGTVQGFLELAQIPYVGAGVAASAVGMDKLLMKRIFRQAGLPAADFLPVSTSEWQLRPQGVLAAIERSIGYPCFVKPANMGSSVGISKAHDSTDLPRALELASQYDRQLIVERFLPDCREIEVSLLGNDQPTASLPGEVITSNEFYDYEAKYLGASEFIIPATLAPAQIAAIQRLAIAGFRAIGCTGMARADCFLDRRTGEAYLNEINTIPGFTPTSMFHRLWEASGITSAELMDRLIALALEWHEIKQARATNYPNAPATMISPDEEKVANG